MDYEDMENEPALLLEIIQFINDNEDKFYKKSIEINGKPFTIKMLKRFLNEKLNKIEDDYMDYEVNEREEDRRAELFDEEQRKKAQDDYKKALKKQQEREKGK